MYELLIYPLSTKKNTIINEHTKKEWRKITKEIKELDFNSFGVKLLEVKKYKDQLIYVKIKYSEPVEDNGNYDPLDETQTRFVKALNEYKPSFYEDKYNKSTDKFIGVREKYKGKWEGFIYN
tara:strand:- start:30 stop:395 length:366 start_codon:yes stop_codon:yes gene_type:complete